MNSPLGRNVTFCSLRYGVSVHDLCTLPLSHSFYRMHFYTGLKCTANFVYNFCTELIMIRENILSIPGMQLTTEDCIWCISQLLT